MKARDFIRKKAATLLTVRLYKPADVLDIKKCEV